MKRVFLFLATNLAVVFLLSITARVLGLDRWLTANGLNLGGLLMMAALFGFFTYATYDLTNWATLKDWPWKLSLIDMAWGTLVSTASAAGGKAALDWATRG